MKAKILILVLMFASISTLVSGNKYEKACLVLNNNDTLHGYVERKSDLRMTLGINYIKDLYSDSISSFQATDIKSITFINENKKYESVKYLQKTKKGNFEHTRLAKLIYEGQINLYKLELPLSELDYKYKKAINYAYVMQIDTICYTLTQFEMVYTKEQDKATYLEGSRFNSTRIYSGIVRDYIDVLRQAFGNCPEISEYLRDLDFNDKSIIKVINIYFNCINVVL